MTLSNVQACAPVAGLFKCVFLYSCAAVNISTDSALQGPSALAEPLVLR